ncbi:MAG: hypothetical protein JNM12_14600 [Alphaproteobacteria bacterium]|nr:hypothetical protein [Alphaproteobacteria bacterium]
MKDTNSASVLHKAAEALDNAAALLALSSPLWLAAGGAIAGLMLAPVIGAGVVVAGVTGGLAGFAGGALSYIAMGSERDTRVPQPANILVWPVSALAEKTYVMALAQEVPLADKKKLKDAFNKSVESSRAARRFVNSGALYANAALAVRNQQMTIDSVIKGLEAKTYPLQVGTYKP